MTCPNCATKTEITEKRTEKYAPLIRQCPLCEIEFFIWFSPETSRPGLRFICTKTQFPKTFILQYAP
jgi:hypothetical protein